MKSLLRKLEKLERETIRKDTGDVVVGYNASYALAVHEDMEKPHGEAYNEKYAKQISQVKELQKAARKHSKLGELRHTEELGKLKKKWRNRGPGQQAKFLEQPYREMRPELVQAVIEARRKGAGIVQSLLFAGLRLQRASQKLVPVDTGNLKGSAFTERE